MSVVIVGPLDETGAIRTSGSGGGGGEVTIISPLTSVGGDDYVAINGTVSATFPTPQHVTVDNSVTVGNASLPVTFASPPHVIVDTVVAACSIEVSNQPRIPVGEKAIMSVPISILNRQMGWHTQVAAALHSFAAVGPNVTPAKTQGSGSAITFVNGRIGTYPVELVVTLSWTINQIVSGSSGSGIVPLGGVALSTSATPSAGDVVFDENCPIGYSNTSDHYFSVSVMETAPNTQYIGTNILRAGNKVFRFTLPGDDNPNRPNGTYYLHCYAGVLHPVVAAPGSSINGAVYCRATLGKLQFFTETSSFA